ncbi:MAG: hypothetical protein FWH23_07275 [Bacteroidales bacterium]|nr:hypothetical protein [Bacteroidales bacterium]
MFKKFLFGILLTAWAFSVYAQETEGATVIFYRDKMLLPQHGMAVISVAHDEVLVFLKYKTFFQHHTTELGEWNFIGGVGKNLSAQLNLTLEEGKTYYVRCWMAEAGLLKYTANFELVDETTALPVIKKYKEMKTKNK